MVRQTNPKKNQQKRVNESNEIPLKAKRKEQKEKYRHQNNWLEDEDFDDEIDTELNLYEEDEDFIFEDELDADFLAEYNDDYKEETSETEEYDDQNNY